MYPIADEAEPPIFADPSVNSTSVRVTWNHTNKGPCFSNLTFSYNITWYPVEKPQGKQRNVTKPGATEYNITNLESKTDYRVELVGFTDSEPPVYSKMAMVDFKTEGMMSACIQECLSWLLAVYNVILDHYTVGHAWGGVCWVSMLCGEYSHIPYARNYSQTKVSWSLRFQSHPYTDNEYLCKGVVQLLNNRHQMNAPWQQECSSLWSLRRVGSTTQ